MSECIWGGPGHGPATFGLSCTVCHKQMNPEHATGTDQTSSAGWLAQPANAALSATGWLGGMEPPVDGIGSTEADLDEPEVVRSSDAPNHGPGKPIEEPSVEEIEATVEAVHLIMDALARGKKLEDHHLLPQQYNFSFLLAGLDIDEYTVTIPEDVHDKLHRHWNRRWLEFLAMHDYEPDRAAILAEAIRLMAETRELAGRRIHRFHHFVETRELE